MGIKPGPKRIAESTGKPDKRQRDNKVTPKNTPSLKPHKHKKGDWFIAMAEDSNAVLPPELKSVQDILLMQ